MLDFVSLDSFSGFSLMLIEEQSHGYFLYSGHKFAKVILRDHTHA